MKQMRWWLLAALVVGGQAWAASPTCSAAANENKVSWPNTTSPVWEMCWLTPQRSSGPRGSGLELRNVHFMGTLVLKRAHAPMLFAEYRNGQGGDCYRDWKDTNASFAAEPAVRNILGTPTTFTAKTSCDISHSATTSYGNCPFNGNPDITLTGANCMTGGGVAVENLPNNGGFVLTTQYSASWYQYTSRFFFYANGDIEPQFGFGNNNGTFNNVTHWHHNYWRFDFDLAGPENDEIQRDGVAQANEFAVVRSRVQTRVFDPVAGFGYVFETGPEDDKYLANESGRNFHQIDLIGARYIANEYGDNPVYSLSDCTMQAANIANNQTLTGQDVVLYYRASVRDSTANDWPTSGASAVPQDSMVCKKVGPILRFVGTITETPLLKDGFE